MVTCRQITSWVKVTSHKGFTSLWFTALSRVENVCYPWFYLSAEEWRDSGAPSPSSSAELNHLLLAKIFKTTPGYVFPLVLILLMTVLRRKTTALIHLLKFNMFWVQEQKSKQEAFIQQQALSRYSDIQPANIRPVFYSCSLKPTQYTRSTSRVLLLCDLQEAPADLQQSSALFHFDFDCANVR